MILGLLVDAGSVRWEGNGHGADRARGRDQGVRRQHPGGRLALARHPRRGLHGVRGPVWVRQVHRAADDRRAGGHHLWDDQHRRARGQRPAAQGPRYRHGVPELRPLPHMTRGENLAFGLQLRKTPKQEQQRRVGDVAKMLGLEPYLKRKPAALSGGQRQRVAMGRAIVREPQAYLMDEPLSNLDAKLRVSMRASLNQLHERLGVTTVYVTHDQVEAMTLGNRVCVLRDGRLQQVDTPQTLFESPVNLFVAGFIGSPAMNFVNAELVRDDGPVVTFAGYKLRVPPELLENKP